MVLVNCLSRVRLNLHKTRMVQVSARWKSLDFVAFFLLVTHSGTKECHTREPSGASQANHAELTVQRDL
jgi:hypothetical protein